MPRIPSGATGHEVIVCDDRKWFDAPDAASDPAPDIANGTNDAEVLTAIADTDWQRLLDALTFLRDKVADNSTWSKVGYALLSLQATRPAQQLWYDFSRNAVGYEPGGEIAWWESHQQQTPRSVYRHIFTMAGHLGWQSPRFASVDAFTPTTTAPGVAPQPVNVDPPEVFPTVEFRKLRSNLYDNPPAPRLFALGGYLPKGIASKFSGPGQLGKSMIMAYAALCQATGREFCGHTCAPGRVVYISAEDDFPEFERRMHRLLHVERPPRAI